MAAKSAKMEYKKIALFSWDEKPRLALRPVRDAPSRGLVSRDGANPEDGAQGEVHDHSSNFGTGGGKSSRRTVSRTAVHAVPPPVAAGRRALDLTFLKSFALGTWNIRSNEIVAGHAKCAR
jgi:hypothetical protein